MSERLLNLSTMPIKLSPKYPYKLTKSNEVKNKFDFVNRVKSLINNEKLLFKINEVKNAFDFVITSKTLIPNTFF